MNLIAKRTTGDESGTVIVLFTLALVVICVAAALALDLGNIAQTHQHAQNSVDDAALSGAGLLAQNESAATVVTAVEAYVEENYSAVSAGEWDSCPATSVPSGFSAPFGYGESCVTFDSTSKMINVVLPPQLVKYTFGRVAGLSSATVETSATAMVSGGTAPCALCVLGPTGLTLDLTGSGGLTVSDTSGNAGIVVDSDGSSAAQITGSGSITAPAIDVVGSTKKTGSGSFNPTPTTGAAPTPDPLAFLTPPPSASGTAIPTAAYVCSGSTCAPSAVNSLTDTYGSITVSGSGSLTIYPGIYSKIAVSGSGSVTLEPGTYIVTGPFSVTGSGSIKEATSSGATGVFFYFTCSSSSTGTLQTAACTSAQAGGSLSLTGSGGVHLSPLTSGTYAGLTVFYDRNDASPTTITGSGGLSFSGTVYAKSSALTLTGSGSAISSMIVVGSTNITGSGSISVAYNESQNVALTGAPYLCSLHAGNC